MDYCRRGVSGVPVRRIGAAGWVLISEQVATPDAVGEQSSSYPA